MRKRTMFVFVMGAVLSLAQHVESDFAAPALNLSNSQSPSDCPRIAKCSGTDYVFVAWVEDDYLLFRRSADNGVSWESVQQLTTSGYLDDVSVSIYRAISIAAEGQYVHVVMQWHASDLDDFEIYYRRNTNYGEPGYWEDWRWLTLNATDSIYPDISVRGEYVHVVYQDNWPGNWDIMYKRIDNIGAGDIDKTRRLTFSLYPDTHPRVALSKSGDVVHVVYEEDIGYINEDIFYKRIADFGAGSYTTQRLTFGSANSTSPDIAVSTGQDDQYVYIVYEDFWPGNMEVMYKRLDNYGNAGATAYTVRLSYSPGWSEWPTVDFDSDTNGIQIAYCDNWTGNYDIFIKQLVDYGGAGFLSKRISWGSGSSVYPAIIAAQSGAHVVWQDYTPGNYEILFKSGY